MPPPSKGVPLEHALQNWLAELRLSNRSQTTIDWYRDLFMGRILPGLKRQGIQRPREPSLEPRVFTVTEVESLLQAASPRDRLIVVPLLETGLRVSELCALQVADFRLDNPDGPYLDVRSGKGRKQRAIPLTTSLTRKLRQYLTHGRPQTRCPSLFVTERSQRGEDHRPLNRHAVEILI